MQPQRTISPVDGRVLVERPLATEFAVAAALERAGQAFASWRTTPVEQRIAVLNRAIDLLVAKREELATEITWQMGRPIAQSAGEIRGLEERARYMLEVAPRALADRPAGQRPGFTRFIRHEPLGLVFVIAPWNYPYLTAVNSIVPASPPATRCCSSIPPRRRCARSAFSRPSTRPGFRTACSSICT